MDDLLLDAARAWLDADPDAAMRAELSDLLDRVGAGDAEATAELADAFGGALAFGTAGLRGRIGPGPNRMNQVVVARAAAGLAAYLNDRGGGAVVIGFDARRDSDLYAATTARILTGAGLSVMMMPEPLPTPVLAFAIRHLGCAAGVMVTASHNPPADNGYKVYLGDGSQIVPPADAEIAAHIAAATALGPVTALPHGDEWVTLDREVVDAYVARAVSLVEAGAPTDVRIAYTAMHGVGGRVLVRVLSEAGFPEPVVVAAQFDPDPAFPTVAFPNPEEPGAMDLGLAIAREADCDLLIANDPDADRCAVAVPGPDGWRLLTGDETGSLLAWWIAAGNRRLSRAAVFAESIVSGTMLARIAASANVGYAQTLTGFKWIARVPDLAYGYEEALGYCVDPGAVRDKDGITAALLIAEAAARVKERGRTLLDVLDDLDRTYGVHATSQVSVRVADLAVIDATMARLRSAPPAHVGGLAVRRVDDFAAGVDGLPPTDGLRFTLAGDARVIVRPSGTEPKVKCYLQCVEQVGDEGLAAVRAAAAGRLSAVANDVAGWLDRRG